MRIVFNSDVLIGLSISYGALPETLQDLFHTCVQKDVAVTIPETTLLEFNRHHSEVAAKMAVDLEHSYKVLERFSIPYDRRDPSEVIRPPDLIGLLRATGVRIDVVRPAIEDFEEAHRRACLHGAPHVPDSKSDEMRDLVIWVISVRLAVNEGGAILLSHDKLHHHVSGDDEARSVGLKRVRTVGDALEDLRGMRTPAEDLVERLLSSIWGDLTDAGLPLADQISNLAVSDSVFTRDDRGLLSSANFRMAAEGLDGVVVRASVDLVLADGVITQVTLSGILAAGVPWGDKPVIITTSRPFDTEPQDYAERLNALESLFGDRHEPENG